MLRLSDTKLINSLSDIMLNGNIQINTINAHSYNVAKKDSDFAKVLLNSDYLLPDGQSIVWAKRWLAKEKITRIAGYDLFIWEMDRLSLLKGKCFFLGSSEATLLQIKNKLQVEYPNVVVETFSPPFKPEFTEKENQDMIFKVNEFGPDVLFVGMTAPKQEKWVFNNIKSLKVGHVCSIGAVFDFYAENIKRAPDKWQKMGLEWLYRLINEPRRMWKRYILGNTKFIYYISKEKYMKYLSSIHKS